MANVSSRTITQPKIQETSSSLLFKCIFDSNDNSKQTNCLENNYKNDVVQTLSRRLGAPLYIPLITIVVSFLLIYKKEKKYNYLKKYTLFILSFLLLILGEILLKYVGFSLSLTIFYFVFPVIISILFYIYLIIKIITEKIA